MTLRERLSLFVATGFGIGLAVPFAPGTFGSIPGVAAAYALSGLSAPVQAAVCAALAAAAVPVCTVAERTLGIRDDGRIVADEWMLFPVAVLGIPVADLPFSAMLLFFAVTRVFDIAKPPPAWQLQSLRGGLGIVLDDLAANVYSLAANWTLYIALFK